MEGKERVGGDEVFLFMRRHTIFVEKWKTAKFMKN
jgi:hypothetical protein